MLQYDWLFTARIYGLIIGCFRSIQSDLTCPNTNICFHMQGKNYWMLIGWDRGHFFLIMRAMGMITWCWLVISCLATKRYCRWNWNWNCILRKKKLMKLYLRIKGSLKLSISNVCFDICSGNERASSREYYIVRECNSLKYCALFVINRWSQVPHAITHTNCTSLTITKYSVIFNN